jgi:hypothetical protein
MNMKLFAIIWIGVTVVAVAVALTGCERDADVASKNLSNDADNFKIPRRVVFYNGITDKYMLEIRGLCAIKAGESAKSITVTCKISDTKYKKNILGLSDNVTYFVEQLDETNVSTSS